MSDDQATPDSTGDLADLEALAPRELSRAAPRWQAARAGVLDEVLSDSTRTRRRWLAVAVAAAVVLVVSLVAFPRVTGSPPPAAPPTPTNSLTPTVATSSGRATSSQSTRPAPVPSGSSPASTAPGSSTAAPAPSSGFPHTTPTAKAAQGIAPVLGPDRRVVSAGVITQVMGTGDPMVLCYAYALKGRLPRKDDNGCEYYFPVKGLTWGDLGQYQTTKAMSPSTATERVSSVLVVEGIWEGPGMRVTALVDLPAGDTPWMTYYGYPSTELDYLNVPPPACNASGRDGSQDGFAAVEELLLNRLPTAEVWYTSSDLTLNVWVSSDLEGSKKAIDEVFDGRYCLQLGRGIPWHLLQDRIDAMSPLYDQIPFFDAREWQDQKGGLLRVGLEVLTPEIYQQVLAVAGPASPAVYFAPVVYPVP